MDRQIVELSALGFQTLFTLILAAVYYSLWLRQRRQYFATWSLAWALYAMRLVFIQAFLVRRYVGWLFLHQAVTGIMALLLWIYLSGCGFIFGACLCAAQAQGGSAPATTAMALDRGATEP